LIDERPIRLGFRGAAAYADAFPGLPETEPRIYVEFRPEGVPNSFLALLDTGAPYCILNREVTALVKEQLTDPLGPTALKTAHGRLQGELYLLRLVLIADTGEDHDLDSVVFIAPDWEGPSFLGYSGLLARLRFAVDPRTNRFYFG
jgi:hypothetical protein